MTLARPRFASRRRSATFLISRRKPMSSIERRVRDGRVRWYARYRDPSGQQRTKTFSRRVDADRYLTTVESSKLQGAYVDPARSRFTVGAMADQWMRGKINLKPTT